MRGRTGCILAAALAVILIGGMPSAMASPSTLDGVELARRDDLISRDRAADIARSATGGRVLRVELRGGDRPWYRVRVLIDGERVRSVAVDARSGRLRR